MIRDVKTNPYHIIRTFISSYKLDLNLKIGIDFKNVKSTELPICDRYQTGSSITKAKIDDVFEIISLEETPVLEEKEVIDLDKIDQRILTIDDFLEDFKFKK